MLPKHSHPYHFTCTCASASLGSPGMRGQLPGLRARILKLQRVPLGWFYDRLCSSLALCDLMTLASVNECHQVR